MANKVHVDLDLNVQGYQQGIQQATESTAAYESETRKVADAQVNLMKELKAAKKEVQNLAAGYAKLDEEAKNSAFGQEMARQLQIAKEKAAEYIDLQGDLNTELRNMASDTAVLDTLSDGLSGLGHTMSAVTGVMGIFTDDTELMTKAVTMFTTAESIASAAIKVKNLLEKQSSLMLGISKMQQLAATAAVELDTAAKGKNAIATGAATIAQKALNAAANANPYVLLATAVLGVVSALGFFTSSSEDAEKAQQKLNQQLAEGTARAIEYANAMNSVYDVVLKYMNEVGASSWAIEDKKLEAATDKANRLKEIWYEVSHNRGEGESYEAWEQRIDQAYQAWKAADDARIKVEDDIQAHRRAVQDLIDNWENLDTEKQIRAAISAFQNLRSEYRQGTAEYNEMGRRIEILQKKINPKSTTVKPIKVNTPNTTDIPDAKKQIKTYEEAISEYDRLTNRVKTLNQFMAEGRVEPEFLDKFKEEIKSVQDEIDNISTDWHIKAKVEIEIDPEQIKKDKEAIAKILDGVFKTDDKPVFDFNYLPEEFKKSSDKLLDEFNRVASARKQLEAAMSAEDASDTTIAEAQRGLETIIPLYDQLIEKLQIYQELDNQTEKMIKRNEKLADTYNNIADCMGSVGDMFSSLSEIADDDPALQVMGIVAKAVANMFAGYAQAVVQAASMGPWAWAAFAAAGLAQTLALVAQIKQATAFADGGVVGGHSYFGDKILARLNSGELILNNKDQRKLDAALENNIVYMDQGQQVTVTGVVRGTDLMLVQKNTSNVMKRAGNSIKF